MTELRKLYLTDANGNTIGAEADHLGKYHLAVTANQDVNEDPNNTSTTNLAAADTLSNTVSFRVAITSSLLIVRGYPQQCLSRSAGPTSFAGRIRAPV